MSILSCSFTKECCGQFYSRYDSWRVVSFNPILLTINDQLTIAEHLSFCNDGSDNMRVAIESVKTNREIIYL